MTRLVPSPETPSQPQHYSSLENAAQRMPTTMRFAAKAGSAKRSGWHAAVRCRRDQGGERQEKEQERQELTDFSMDCPNAKRQDKTGEHQFREVAGEPPAAFD